MSMTLRMEQGTSIDNLSIYDSAEDGIDPQGAAVWLHGNGRIGVAWQAPQVLQTQVGVSVAGVPLPLSFVGAWLLSNPAPELLTLAYSSQWFSSASSLREVAFEADAAGGIPMTPGITYGISCVSAAGAVLQAGAWFQ
jgi:hypothetical protein